MTDKEIIIDGVNAAECEYHTNLSMDCTLMPLQNLACKNNPNCYYKQLKRLEAENVEIKTSYINFIAKLKREMITKDDIQDLKNTVKKFVEERNSLKAENERLKFKLDTVEADYEASEIEVKDLKSEITFLRTVNDHLSQLDYYRRKTNKTLQGIKKIAETCTSCGDCGCAISQMSHILDLITKAESEG